MVRLIPCNKTISSEMAARKYRDHVWKDFGLPYRIISDRGPQFVSSFTRALNSLLGISENFSTSRHPQTDGQTERLNQEMEQYLRIFCTKRQHDWAEWPSSQLTTRLIPLPATPLFSSTTDAILPDPSFPSDNRIPAYLEQTHSPNKWLL